MAEHGQVQNDEIRIYMGGSHFFFTEGGGRWGKRGVWLFLSYFLSFVKPRFGGR